MMSCAPASCLDVGPEPLQLVHCEATIPVGVDDLVALAVDEQEQRIETWAREETARPLDLDRAPLLRAQVHLRSASTFQFSLSFHHSILDGWSVATLLTELFAAYAHRLGHAVPPLPAPPAVAFRDYVALERHVLGGPGRTQLLGGLRRGRRADAAAETAGRFPAECAAAPGAVLRQLVFRPRRRNGSINWPPRWRSAAAQCPARRACACARNHLW